MNQDELKKLDESLAREEEQLIRQLQEFSVESPTVKGNLDVKVPEYGNDMYDNALEETDLERNFALKQELQTKLNSIRQAREKLKQGTYGACANCSSAIPEKRLKAVPYAILCMKCASHR